MNTPINEWYNVFRGYETVLFYDTRATQKSKREYRSEMNSFIQYTIEEYGKEK